MRNYIKNIAIHCQGDYACICRIYMNQGEIPDYEYYGNYICRGDIEYPDVLYQLEDPPFILFYEGNIALLQTQMIAIVGSRKPSNYALTMTTQFVESQREKYTIISGLAMGIDARAHVAALDFCTIAVLGCGVDICYPKMNNKLYQVMREKHLLISEYPNGVPPRKHHFPFRNRIIAALGEHLYVMSATNRSGTMHTVNYALTLDRDIIVLPHPINDQSGLGCNVLIQEGANILLQI